MQAMMDFSLWFLTQLPDFLLTEPISGFVGFGFLFVIVALFKRMINI